MPNYKGYFETYEGIIRQEKEGLIYCDIMELDKPVKVLPKNMKKSISGDTVTIKVKDDRFGYVQKIIYRPERVLTGQIQITQKFAFVKPWSHDIFIDCFVEKKNVPSDVKNGDIVEYEITNWGKSQEKPNAKVIKKIYATEDQYVLHRLNLPTKFPEEAINELKDFEDGISNSELSSRADFRNHNIFSIDPASCTDVDDALGIEKTNFGYRVGIHIADVSYFIKAGSELDKEAYNRCFTHYFSSFHVPMIPQKLSSDLCSLMEKKDRLCVSTLVNIDENFNVIDYHVVRSVINSKKKFSYEEAEQHKNNKESQFNWELNKLHEIGEKLRKEWFQYETILDKEEIRWEVDETGEPTKMIVKKRLSTMDLIQSWMLLCNMMVTKVIEQKEGYPWVYRVHEGIDPEKISTLKTQISQLGENWEDTEDFGKNMRRLLKTKNSDIMSDVFLKKMRPAKYSSLKTGHFSLGTDEYAHFTSPIRRYSDIVSHRIMLNAIIDKPVFCANLEEDCKWISEKEKKAQRIENGYNNSLALRFVKNITYQLKGKVINVNKWGMSVKTELGICGDVSFSEFKNLEDLMFFDDKKLIWIFPSDNSFNIQLGKEVLVKIGELDFDRNIIRLDWVELSQSEMLKTLL